MVPVVVSSCFIPHIHHGDPPGGEDWRKGIASPLRHEYSIVPKNIHIYPILNVIYPISFHKSPIEPKNPISQPQIPLHIYPT